MGDRANRHPAVTRHRITDTRYVVIMVDTPHDGGCDRHLHGDGQIALQ